MTAETDDRRRATWVVGAVLISTLVACSDTANETATAEEPAEAVQETNWLSYGNEHNEQRFSHLDQVSSANVGDLKLDWELEIPDAISFVSTPLAIDGTLYFSGDRAIVRAVDAASGELLWSFNPEIHKHAPRQIAQGWNTNRGLAHIDGRLFVGATDGRLIAIDAATGTEIWATRTFDVGERKSITGAPLAFANTVIIGHGGAEYGTRGYVTAYDSTTGEQLWRFYTVPGEPGVPDNAASDSAMQIAAESWHGEWWKLGGGGTVWNAMTYDEELNQVYIGVGNGDPWEYGLRSEGKGDNLFLGSIVAVDADTGEYRWHYQSTPGERWDYKSTMDMVLTDLEIDGVNRKVLMQAPTNGFFYVLDRTNGKVISAEKYTKSNWAERIDLTTGRPILSEAAQYEKLGKSLIYPSPFGGHNWQSMSFNPQTGLVYIPETQQPAEYSVGPKPSMRKDFMVIGVMTTYPTLDERDGKGSLLAWDPVAQEARWQVPYEAFWNGGTLTTAGNLVFQGTGAGQFAAFDATSGEQLWSVDVQRGITAPPVTYTVDGEQRVAILVGYGGLASFGLPFLTRYGYKYRDKGIRLLSFSLSGTKELQRLKTRTGELRPADTGSDPIDEELAMIGMGLYHNSSCAVCHGGLLSGSGANGPDLRESAIAQNYEAMRTILKDGTLLANGMPQFQDLSDDEILAITEYVRQVTRATEPVLADR